MAELVYTSSEVKNYNEEEDVLFSEQEFVYSLTENEMSLFLYFSHEDFLNYFKLSENDDAKTKIQEILSKDKGKIIRYNFELFSSCLNIYKTTISW